MSKELEELRRLARVERHRAFEHARAIPARVGDTVGAFARRHPIIAMGGAAALTVGFLARRRRRAGLDGKPGSLPAALAALGVNFMPEILKLVGLGLPMAKEPDDEEPETRHEHCEVPAVGLANSAARGSESTSPHESIAP